MAINYPINYSKNLQSILKSELELGNEIDSVGQDYPIEGAIWVMLKKPFLQSYAIPDVAYKKVNDIRYWFEEYADKTLHHLLLTGFEK